MDEQSAFQKQVAEVLSIMSFLSQVLLIEFVISLCKIFVFFFYVSCVGNECSNICALTTYTNLSPNKNEMTTFHGQSPSEGEEKILFSLLS